MSDDDLKPIIHAVADGTDIYFTLLKVMTHMKPTSIGAALLGATMLARTYERLAQDDRVGQDLLDNFKASAESGADRFYEDVGIGPRVRGRMLAEVLDSPDAAFSAQARADAQVIAERVISEILKKGGAG